jgi:hypothetical protein
MFVDCSHLLPARSTATLAGATTADVDGDGQFEFLLAANGANRVLKWTGAGFRDVAPPELADAERDGRGCIAADIDGDGREELYLVNDGAGADRLLDCEPHGWTDRLATVSQPVATRAAAAFDRRGNGRYALALAGNDGPLRLLEFPDRATVADLAPALGIDLPLPGAALAAAPWASTRTDLFLAGARGSNALFRNTGLGTFLEVAAEHGLDDPDESSVAAIPLDDGDGQFALAVATADGPHRLFVRRDDGSYRNLASPALAFPGDARALIAADFDNDGREELLIFLRGEPNRLFRQDGGHWHALEPGPLGALGAVTGATVADIDRDGALELLLTRGSAAPALWKSPASANAWLRVRPFTRFGAPARGAVVRLVAGGRTQVRVVCGGCGTLGQHEPVAHFGLGALDRVEHVQVTWPDGTLARLEAPTVRTTIDMRYPGT